jgi:hypothetical protein
MKEVRGTDRRQSQRSIRKARTSPRLEPFISRLLPWKSSFVRPRNPLCFNECQPIPTRAGGGRGKAEGRMQNAEGGGLNAGTWERPPSAGIHVRQTAVRKDAVRKDAVRQDRSARDERASPIPSLPINSELRAMSKLLAFNCRQGRSSWIKEGYRVAHTLNVAESRGGPPHSRTLTRGPRHRNARSVLECARPLALFVICKPQEVRASQGESCLIVPRKFIFCSLK